MTTKTIMTDKQPRLGNKYIAKISMDKDSYDIFELMEITEGITGIIIYVFNIHLRDTDLIVPYQLDERVFKESFIQIIT